MGNQPRNQKNLPSHSVYPGDQTFCGIVEVAVLTKAARFHTGENDGLGDDFCVLFRLGFVLYFIRPGIQIHVLVDEMQEVVAV